MKNNFYFLVTLIFLLSSCTTYHRTGKQSDLKDESNWEMMTGKWYNSRLNKDGSKTEELAVKDMDGTFVFYFKTTGKTGKSSLQIEKGDWGVSGNIYFTTVKTIKVDNEETAIDLEDSYFRDAYIIRKLTDNEFVYESVVSGETFTAKKVNNNFILK